MSMYEVSYPTVKVWGDEDINLPPADWFRGVWYAEKKRREMEKKRRKRIMAIKQVALVIGTIAFFLGTCWGLGGF